MTLHRSSTVARLVVAFVAAVTLGGGPASAASAAPPESYVAMGDSYTAGPLIPNQLPDPLGCGRSDRNYPHLVAEARRSALRDRSCSGAETTHLASPQPVLGGPNPPQLDALDAGVSAVSLQIGGNDIGFGEILQRCLAIVPLGTPCRDFYTRGGVDELSRRIAVTAPAVRAALAEVRRRSPQARLFVVGYPAILPEAQPGCWPVMPITPGDVPYLRDKEKELNTMLAAEAASGGAYYVDVYTASVGHDACQLPGIRWIEAAIPLALAAPVHPNALGMRRMADILLAAMAR